MPAVRSTRRIRLVAAVAGSALLAAGALTHSAALGDRLALGQGSPRANVLVADAQMPPAPRDKAAWSRAVAHAYAAVDHGRGAEAWLRLRMARRQPGERLAVVMGVDDVIVGTHFGGIETLVPRSARFVRTAHALGYAVFYVTGRSYANGLGRITSFLERAHVPANAFYGRPSGAADEASAKAQCRAAIAEQGYTLAMTVAADGASFVGTPRAEQEVRLPDFAQRG